MEEIWKDIEGYEGLYQISNIGQIKALEKPRISPSGGVGIRPEKILKTWDNQRGYLQIVIRKNNIPKGHKIHRLVAEHFIPNPNKYPQVNHKNGIKTDNRVENLEWCTAQENIRHSWKNGLSTSLMDNPKITKSVFQYDKDGAFIREWISASNCGRNGYSRVGVRDCCLNRQMTHRGYIWKYKEDVING